MRKKRLIKHQLIASHFFVAVSIFILAVTIFCGFTYRLLLTQSNESIEAQLGAIVNQVELEVGRMDTVLLNILYSSTIKENYDAIGVDLATNQEITDAMIAINGPRLEVQQINAYTLDGRVLSAGFNSRYITEDIRHRPWYTETLAREGKRYISVPEESTRFSVSVGDQRYISIYRNCYNKYNELSGIIEVMRDVRYIFSSVTELFRGGEFPASVYVFGPEGQRVYWQGGGAEPFEIGYDALAANWVPGERDSFRMTGEGGAYRVSVLASEDCGWVFAMAMPERVIYRPVNSLLAIMIALSVVAVLLTLALSGAVAHRIATPINQLHAAIAGTTLHNIHETKLQADNGPVEITELARAFAEMTAQLSRSVADTIEANKQEAQARLLALQAQMNPHFLYNSLTNISVMAEKGMNEGIVEMCRGMSFMLRYASSAANSIATVADEMEYVQNYLDCMKIRYGQYLHYHIDMEPGTEAVRLPKLSVQPLVENAIRHGVGEDSTWRIHIRSEAVAEDGWRISVRSDGAGMEPEKLEALYAQMAELDENGSYPQLSIKGMGLLNLYCRLRLYLGSRAEFAIEGAENSVTVTLGRKPTEGEAGQHGDGEV